MESMGFPAAAEDMRSESQQIPSTKQPNTSRLPSGNDPKELGHSDFRDFLSVESRLQLDHLHEPSFLVLSLGKSRRETSPVN
jgi:hypothetical protein